MSDRAMESMICFSVLGTVAVWALASCGDVSTSMIGSALTVTKTGTCADNCPDQVKSRSATGHGSAIADTRADAEAIARQNAEDDAKVSAALKAMNALGSCPDGCAPFGEPGITYGTVRVDCKRSGTSTTGPDSWPRGGDGIGDGWQWACRKMSGLSAHDSCTSTTTATNKPFFASCVSYAKATATQICVSEGCACTAMTEDAEHYMCSETDAADLPIGEGVGDLGG